jgi:hypothetical protein
MGIKYKLKRYYLAWISNNKMSTGGAFCIKGLDYAVFRSLNEGLESLKCACQNSEFSGRLRGDYPECRIASR